MRTTIDLDPHALDILRDLAAVENRSLGKVASELILQAVESRKSAPRATRNGVPLLPARPGVVVTNQLVDEIREKEGV
jgi:hypothetical protein